MTGVHDVVVIGGGCAGLAAAIAARERGARVLLVESGRKVGGNSRLSRGIFRVPASSRADLTKLIGTRARPQEGSAYTEADFLFDLERYSRQELDPDLACLVVEQTRDFISWSRKLGVSYELFVSTSRDRDGSLVKVIDPGMAVAARGGGEGLMTALARAAAGIGVEIRCGAEVLALEPGQEGAWLLDVRDRLARDLDTLVARSVVVASGGFQANRHLVRRHLGDLWEAVPPRGSAENRGRLFEALSGSGVAHSAGMDGLHAAFLHTPFVGRGDTGLGAHDYRFGIVVNELGQRFFDEGDSDHLATYSRAGRSLVESGSSQAFQIFDSKGLPHLGGAYKRARPMTGRSWAELASRCGLPRRELDETITMFNDAASGSDPMRFDPLHPDAQAASDGLTVHKSNWARPLDSPPYVAFPVVTGISFTFGGFKVAKNTALVDNADVTIDGLFGAGDAVGGLFFDAAPGGSGLASAAVLGRRAGDEAAGLALGR